MLFRRSETSCSQSLIFRPSSSFMPNGSTDTKRAAPGLLRGRPEPAIQPINQRLNDTLNYTLNLNSTTSPSCMM